MSETTPQIESRRRCAGAEQVAVRPAKSGDGWEVVPEGHRRGLVRKDKQRAFALARERLGERSGGQVLVLNPSGKVTDSFWVRLEPSDRRESR